MYSYKPRLCALNRVFYVSACQGQSTQNYGLSLQHVICMCVCAHRRMWIALKLAVAMMLFMMMDCGDALRESLAGRVNWERERNGDKEKVRSFLFGLRNVSCLHLTVWLSICRCFVQSALHSSKGLVINPFWTCSYYSGCKREKKKTGKPGCNHIGVLGVGLHSHGLTNTHRHTHTGCYTHTLNIKEWAKPGRAACDCPSGNSAVVEFLHFRLSSFSFGFLSLQPI